MPTLTLTEEELRDLTHRQQHRSQVVALRAMGIEHRIRADGTVAVLRAHVEHLLGAPVTVRKEDSWEPSWES